VARDVVKLVVNVIRRRLRCWSGFGVGLASLDCCTGKITNVDSCSMSSALNEKVIDPVRKFAKDSYQLVKKCTKPDKKEFFAVASATSIGFIIMGFTGFFVKLIHIPINNIIIGG